MASIELVVTDLDGTLWAADESIHEDTLGALRVVESLGIPLLVATGRRRRSARAGLARADLQPPAVLLGGALGVDLASDDEFHRHPFARDDALAVLEVFLDHGAEPIVYVDRGDVEVIVGAACATHPDHLRRITGGVLRADPRAALAEHPVLNMGLIGGEPEALGAIARDIGDHAVAVVNRDLFFGGVTLMVAPAGITKWEGVVAYCERAGVDPANTLALGDGNNDVEVLSNARIACVVEDAEGAALAAADHVIPRAVDGGWAQVLRFLT